MKQLTENHLRALALACGVLLIAFGAAKHAFSLNLGAEAEKWITDGLFFAAALAFLQLFRMRRRARDAARKP